MPETEAKLSNGRSLGIPLYGRNTSQLLAAYNELAGVDIRGQYLGAL